MKYHDAISWGDSVNRSGLRWLMGFTAALLVLGAVGQYMARPLLGHISASAKTYQSREMLWRAYSDLVRRAPEIKKLYSRYARYVQNNLIRVGQEGVFLAEIESIARQVPVKVISQQPYQINESQSHTDMKLQIDIEASFNDLTVFFQQIESSDKLMRVRKVRVYPKDNDVTIFRAQVEILRRYVK